jgi:hypothetical protein
MKAAIAVCVKICAVAIVAGAVIIVLNIAWHRF